MSDKTEKIISFVIIILLILIFISSSNITSYIINDNLNNLTIENNGGLSVNIQDQTTRPFDLRVNQILDNSSYALASVPVVDGYDLVLNDTTGLNVGDNIAFLEQNGMAQIYFGKIINIAVNTITLNSPVPYNFTPSKTFVFTFSSFLNVDGSTTTQIFSINNFFNESIDIVRFIFHCVDDTEMHDGLFCGENQLTRGLVLRKKKNDGKYINYWNIRTNGKWAEYAYDTTYNDKGKPPDETYGFASRLSYGGQAKHGVVIRLAPNESIELLVQDDLTDIPKISLMVEGHFVQN